MCHFPHAAIANMPTTLSANITCGWWAVGGGRRVGIMGVAVGGSRHIFRLHYGHKFAAEAEGCGREWAGTWLVCRLPWSSFIFSVFIAYFRAKLEASW